MPSESGLPGDEPPEPQSSEPRPDDEPTTTVDPVRMGVLISAAVGVVGITFGVLADSAGLSLAQAMAMSLLVFTGASQFAAVSVVSAGGTELAALGTAILLAARNTLYGPIVAQWLDGSLLKRLGLAHFIIDESAGVGAAQADRRAARIGFLVTGIGVFVAWNLGTVIGVLSGDLIGDPGNLGLDVAFPASFLALLAPHLSKLPGRVTALCGVLIVLATVSFTPVGVPILLASLAVIPGMVVLRRHTDRNANPNPNRNAAQGDTRSHE